MFSAAYVSSVHRKRGKLRLCEFGADPACRRIVQLGTRQFPGCRTQAWRSSDPGVYTAVQSKIEGVAEGGQSHSKDGCVRPGGCRGRSWKIPRRRGGEDGRGADAPASQKAPRGSGHHGNNDNNDVNNNSHDGEPSKDRRKIEESPAGFEEESW